MTSCSRDLVWTDELRTAEAICRKLQTIFPQLTFVVLERNYGTYLVAGTTKSLTSSYKVNLKDLRAEAMRLAAS